jgi:hypothetical protein
MEITIGDYGCMIFEMMTGQSRLRNMPEHWASIAKEATPLVEQLLALNQKMKSREGGYSIVGYKDKTGKVVRSEHERISMAQKKSWCATAGELKEGDLFWVNDGRSDIEMYIGQDDPVQVDEITKKGVYFEMQHCGGEHTEKIGLDTKVLKAPADFEEKEDLYTSKKYWLEQADKMGI